MSVEST